MTTLEHQRPPAPPQSSRCRRELWRDLPPPLLLAAVFLFFSILSPQFLSLANLLNILVHSSSIAIIAAGMTIVLLTAGIDLSVGAIMFVTAAIAGKLILGEASLPVPLALALIVLLGIACGAINGLLITRLGMIPFIVTLAMLFIGRGFALWLTDTRPLHLPPQLLQIGHTRLLGIPVPIYIMAAVIMAVHVLLTHTPFGRQLYATGHDPEAARKAGINTRRLLLIVYILSGTCAAVGGIVAVAQLGTVSPTFGQQREFAAIAAAVLGGTSLFGGEGKVLPGTLIGAILIQTIESGLNQINANPYIYPLITASIIFLAVLLDRVRKGIRAG
jgi:ribose transport system permease protein